MLLCPAISPAHHSVFFHTLCSFHTDLGVLTQALSSAWHTCPLIWPPGQPLPLPCFTVIQTVLRCCLLSAPSVTSGMPSLVSQTSVRDLLFAVTAPVTSPIQYLFSQAAVVIGCLSFSQTKLCEGRKVGFSCSYSPTTLCVAQQKLYTYLKLKKVIRKRKLGIWALE